MIEEAFVSQDIIDLLNEKGFPFKALNRSGKKGNWCSQQMAMCWLREEHGIHINPTLCVKNVPAYFCWVIYQDKTFGIFHDVHLPEYPKYEISVEEAIKYCLENLI